MAILRPSLCQALLFVTVFVGLGVGGTASALAEIEGKTISLSMYHDKNGDPSLIANWNSDSDEEPTFIWERCDPGGDTCVSLGSNDGIIEPGEAVPGTTYKVRLATAPSGEVLNSPPWLGRVAMLSPPQLNGSTTVGSVVAGTAGVWSGGWSDDISGLAIYACKRLGAKTCDKITSSGSTYNEKIARVRIGAYYRDWTLIVEDDRYASDLSFTLPLLPTTRPNPLLAKSYTQRGFSQPYGPVRALPGLAAAIRKRVKLRGRWAAVAVFSCPMRCRAQASVWVLQPSRRKVESVLDLQSKSVFGRRGQLRIPTRYLRRNEGLRISVRIDGALAAKGHAVIRR